jgi:hypothetical protein
LHITRTTTRGASETTSPSPKGRLTAPAKGRLRKEKKNDMRTYYIFAGFFFVEIVWFCF